MYSLMAEMFGVLLEGVRDGGQPEITKLYKKYDTKLVGQDLADIVERLNNVLTYITEELAPAITGPVARAPHFLMLYAAVAHALFGIPEGQMDKDMPSKDGRALSNVSVAQENISKLSNLIESDEPILDSDDGSDSAEEANSELNEFKITDAKLRDFWIASVSSTQRIASRRVRFPIYYEALLPVPLNDL